MDEASSEQTKGRGQHKRQWSKNEEQKLVEALQDLANTSWKSNNGTFKNGYLQELEKMLAKKLPNCGLKAQPHIESHVKILKKQYTAIMEMLGPQGSGFGWNEQDQCVIADKDVYDDWVKGHPNAKGLRNKPFPYLVALGPVFGKDRANGYGAEAPGESVEAINQEDDHIEEDRLDNIQSSMPVTQTPNGTPAREGPSIHGRKKRVRADDSVIARLTEIANKLGTIYKSSNENIAKIAEAFQIETDRANRRMKVSEEILKIPDVAFIDHLKAAEIISADPHKTDFFFTLPSFYKKLWVDRLLAGDA